MTHRPAQRGYVLVLTLVLLALAAVAMLSIVMHSMQAGLQSATAADELQRRWGTLSCQSVVVKQAVKIIEAEEKRVEHPVASVTRSIQLGRQRFDLIVSDEQAKANLTWLYDRNPLQDVERTVAQLSQAKLRRVSVKLSPMRDPIPPEEKKKTADPATQPAPTANTPPAEPIRQRPPRAPNGPDRRGTRDPRQELPQQHNDGIEPPPDGGGVAFISYQQVFDRPTATDLANEKATAFRPGITHALTLWGEGKVNFFRCGEDVIRAVTSDVLNDNQVRLMVDARRQKPLPKLQEIVASLMLQPAEQEAVSGRLTDKSACYSVWIIARAPARSWYRLVVIGGDKGGGELCYEW